MARTVTSVELSTAGSRFERRDEFGVIERINATYYD